MPIDLIAILSAGLRDDSRIKMEISGQKAPTNTMLLASMTDSLNWLVWSKTKGADKGKNKPKSILEKLLGSTELKDEVMGFESGSEFDKAWKKLGGG